MQTRRSYLTLLSMATERQRRDLVAALRVRGFDDVNLSGARILRVLGREPKIVQALADATGTTKQFAAREVRHLAEAGYVETSPSPADGRAVLVKATRRGHRLLAASDREKRRLDAGVEARLGPRDARELRRLLARLVGPTTGDG